MTFEDPILFEKAGEKLLPHLEHKVLLTAYGGECAPDSIAVECENCREVLIDFSPDSATEHDRDDLKLQTTLPQKWDQLVGGCLLLIEQYDSVPDFQLGGNLTNRPFLIIRDALNEFKTMARGATTINGNG